MTHPVVVGIRGKEENQDQKSLDVNVFSMERTGGGRGDLGPGGIKKEMNMGGGREGGFLGIIQEVMGN